MTPDCTLPDGFERLHAGPTTAVLRSSEKERLLALGILDESRFRATLADGEPVGGGRGTTVAVRLDPSGTERAVVRHYHRGGLFGGVLRDKYLSGARPFRELRVCEAARAAGVPTPQCLAAVVRRSWPFCTADLVVREVPGAVSLETWLRQKDKGGATASLREMTTAFADAFARLVAADIYHPDLHAGNVLVRERGGLRVYVIDFDKARQVPGLPDSLRERMIFRFNRALVKRGLAPHPVGLLTRMRFLRELSGGRDTRRLAAACAEHLRYHSWRYRL